MLNFEYKGISAGKYVEGEIEALNNSEAAYKLKEQKVIITKLTQAKKKKKVKDKKKSSGFSFGKGVKAQDILIFAKQLAKTLEQKGYTVSTHYHNDEWKKQSFKYYNIIKKSDVIYFFCANGLEKYFRAFVLRFPVNYQLT